MVRQVKKTQSDRLFVSGLFVLVLMVLFGIYTLPGADGAPVAGKGNKEVDAKDAHVKQVRRQLSAIDDDHIANTIIEIREGGPARLCKIVNGFSKFYRISCDGFVPGIGLTFRLDDDYILSFIFAVVPRGSKKWSVYSTQFVVNSP